MKQLKLLALALSLIGVFGCEKDSVQPTEPEFVEKYKVTGYVDNTYTEFNSQYQTEAGGTNPDGDSVEVTKSIDFYAINDNNLKFSITRSWLVPKQKLVINSLLTENHPGTWYKAQFINFQDFVDEFHVGEYKNDNYLIDMMSTSVILNEQYYFSYYQNKSNFHFNVDTLLVNEELEMIYLAGTLSSLNSKGYSDNTEVINLENMHFSFCLKNKASEY